MKVGGQDIDIRGDGINGKDEIQPKTWLPVSVVIPTLNEAENLQYVLQRIPPWVHEVIIVDGYSTDNTVAVAKELLPSVQIVYQERSGKGDALLTGFASATGKIIVALDADGSQDPAEMSTFVGALLSGGDYVKGSRFIQGGGTEDMGTYRFLGNWFLRMIVRILYGGRYSDLCYGYNAFWKDVLPHLQLDASGFEIEAMMNVNALTAGLNVVEVPSFEAKRRHGKSHLKSVPDGWRVLKTIFRSRFKSSNGSVVKARRQGISTTSNLHLADRPYASFPVSPAILCPACGSEMLLDVAVTDDGAGVNVHGQAASSG
jgi:glycosyltransferase involved in cell wall biosynthesis